MKKLRQFTWMLLTIACATPLFSSCNDDDDKGSSADFSKGVYQVYEVNFNSNTNATVVATLRSRNAQGDKVRLGKDQWLLANGKAMQYSSTDDYDYYADMISLAATKGVITIELFVNKSTCYTNSVSSDYVSAPDLSNFPTTLKARQDYNIGFTPAPGEKVTLSLLGSSESDEKYYPTVSSDGSFTAPAFTSSSQYTARIIVSRDKTLSELGPNDSGYIRAYKWRDKPVRIQK